MTFIRPSTHVVRDTFVAKMFRNRLRCPDIITFFSLDTGQWILAYWIEKRINMVDEVEDLGMAFELVTPELVKQIVQCWKPVNWKDKKRRLLARNRDKIQQGKDNQCEDQDRYDWLKKRMKKPVPYAFKSRIDGGEVETPNLGC